MTGSEKKKRGRPPKAAGKGKGAAAAAGSSENGDVTLIKKYGNRRLYDTRRSKYVTLEDLVDVIGRGEEIQVVDATTGEDVTKRVMTQIILHEEESRHLNLLPLNFLKKLIQHRDESMREYFQKYLMMSLDMYMQAQRAMEQRMEGLAGGMATGMPQIPGMPAMPGMGGMPGMMPGMPGAVPPGMDPARMAAMFPWMGMVNPMGVPVPPAAAPTPPPAAPPPAAEPPPDEHVSDDIAELKKRLADLESRYRKK
ncbi:MAG: polyhydroxyalkanoate synthesis repressor PhaR [Myxococcota bacterium]